jgi:hypothetical protein
MPQKNKVIERAIVESRAPGLVGNSHRYKTEKGEISLLHPCMATMGKYEIYCIRGDLFEGIERYLSLEDAEARINALLSA